MEAGKKYLNNHSNLKYDCICILPSGNAVVCSHFSAGEFVISSRNFKNFTEVKEKKKVYVFLWRKTSTGAWKTEMYGDLETAEDVRTCFLSERQVSEIKEVEFDV